MLISFFGIRIIKPASCCEISQLSLRNDVKEVLSVKLSGPTNESHITEFVSHSLAESKSKI